MKARSPYRLFNMGSLDKADHMLLRQYKFPYEYDETRDHHICEYHDRLLENVVDFSKITLTHTGSGDMGIGDWARAASPKRVIQYFIEAMNADRSINWTGFRVTGTVNRSDGKRVYSLELFAKHPKSKTAVYTGDGLAPNVETPTLKREGNGLFRYE